uniref:FKRP stem domain-containing protein n=1 Tax=Anopheles stephensi TaxID=30069 RepID=A0A182YM99_ANOST
MQTKGKMRMKYGKLFIFFMICFNLIVFYYSWKYFLTSGHYLAETLTGGDHRGPALPRRLGIAPDSIPLVSYESSYRIGDPGGATLNRMRLKPTLTEDIDGRPSAKERVQHTNGFLRKSITFVFRDFYDFDNDLLQSIGSVTALIPGVSVFVIAPELPYPPLDIFNPPQSVGAGNHSAASKSTVLPAWFSEGSNVRFFHLAYDVTKTLKDTFPVLHVSTRYVLFMPDSVRLTGRGLLSRMLREIDTPSGSELLLQQHQHLLLKQNGHGGGSFDPNRKPERRIVAVPFASNAKGAANCVQMQLDLPNWTLEYVTGNESERCDMFKQKHAILVETELLKEMPDALASPFPDVFYIQAKLAGVKVRTSIAYHPSIPNKSRQKTQLKGPNRGSSNQQQQQKKRKALCPHASKMGSPKLVGALVDCFRLFHSCPEDEPTPTPTGTIVSGSAISGYGYTEE